MKVSDILSTTTVGSSRALSTAAAIIGVVVVTGTPPSDIPMIRFIKIEPALLYGIATVLLAYMSAAHYLNWRQDVLTYRETLIDEFAKRADTIKELADAYRTAYEKREPSRDSAELEARVQKVVGLLLKDRSQIWRRLKQSSRLTVYGAHFAVPFGLSAASIGLLTNRIIECANAACC